MRLKNPWMILVSLSIFLLPCSELFALTKVTVGGDLTANYFAFTTPNNGESWTFSNIPSVDSGTLNGVSCAGSNCVSVGQGTHSAAPFNMPFVYTSDDNGDSWDPSFFGSPVSGLASLSSVDCQLDGFCATVGFNFITPGPILFSPLGYRSNNFGRRKSWTAFVFPTPVPFPDALLRGISCKGINCAAVGSSQDNPPTTVVPLAYATNNGGASWTLSPTPPLPVGETGGVMTGVNCFNSPNCVAVGFTIIGTPLAYVSNDNGNNWVLSNALPLPVDGVGASLNSVTCTTSNCIAVGQYNTAALGIQPVAYISTDNGTNWSLTSSFVFPFPVTTLGSLNGVACDGAECIAVGSNTLLGNIQEPLAYRSIDGGLNWILSSPSLAGTGITDGALNAIAVAG